MSGLLEKAKKAVRDPDKISPYLKSRILSYCAAVEFWFQKREMPRQRYKVDDLRSCDNWLLIILDACRYDMFEKGYKKYLDGHLEPVVSEGVNTFEYGRLIWGDDQYNVDYVSAATPIHSEPMDFSCDEVTVSGLNRQGEELQDYYQGFVPKDHISRIIDVWKTGWSKDLGVTPPEIVTNKAIEEAASTDNLVVHYFQPHAPYIGEEKALGGMDKEDVDNPRGVVLDTEIYNRIYEGDISDARLKELYKSNLDRVLREVAELVNETDFKNIAVVGDHGEALGEYNQYLHSNRKNPFVRIVPWFEIEEVKHSELEARQRVNIDQDDAEASVQNRLKQLGYLS